MGLNYVLAFPSAVLFHLLMFFLLSATKTEEESCLCKLSRWSCPTIRSWECNHAAGVLGVEVKTFVCIQQQLIKAIAMATDQISLRGYSKSLMKAETTSFIQKYHQLNVKKPHEAYNFISSPQWLPLPALSILGKYYFCELSYRLSHRNDSIETRSSLCLWRS